MSWRGGGGAVLGTNVPLPSLTPCISLPHGHLYPQFYFNISFHISANIYFHISVSISFHISQSIDYTISSNVPLPSLTPCISLPHGHLYPQFYFNIYFHISANILCYISANISHNNSSMISANISLLSLTPTAIFCLNQNIVATKYFCLKIIWLSEFSTNECVKLIKLNWMFPFNLFPSYQVCFMA